MMKKWVMVLMMISLISVALLPEKTQAATVFKDVSSTSPYYTAIKWAKENRITNGYADGTFKPNATVSEGEFLQLTTNFFQLAPVQQKITKKDNTSNQFDGAYAIAAQYEVPLNGYLNNSIRKNPIKRGLVAQIIGTYMGIDSDMKSQIEYIINANISGGQNNAYQNNKNKIDLYFGAENNLTRAQAIQFLYNMNTLGIKSITATSKEGNITKLAQSAMKKVHSYLLDAPSILEKVGTVPFANYGGIMSTVQKDGKLEIIYTMNPRGRVDTIKMYASNGKLISNKGYNEKNNPNFTPQLPKYTAKFKEKDGQTIVQIYTQQNKLLFSYTFNQPINGHIPLIGDNHLVLSYYNKKNDSDDYALFDLKGNLLYTLSYSEEQLGNSYYLDPVYVSPNGILYVHDPYFFEKGNGVGRNEVYYSYDLQGNLRGRTKLPSQEIVVFDAEENIPYKATMVDGVTKKAQMMNLAHYIYKFK